MNFFAFENASLKSSSLAGDELQYGVLAAGTNRATLAALEPKETTGQRGAHGSARAVSAQGRRKAMSGAFDLDDGTLTEEQAAMLQTCRRYVDRVLRAHREFDCAIV